LRVAYFSLISRPIVPPSSKSQSKNDVIELLRHSFLLQEETKLEGGGETVKERNNAEGKRTSKQKVAKKSSDANSSSSSKLCLTRLGVQFLLESRQTQLFILLKSYLNMCDVCDCLFRFFFFFF
jgi:hypothetical protein